MTIESDSQAPVELRLSYRYAKEHAWVVQAVTGFLSAYFMEHPGFRVQRHLLFERAARYGRSASFH